MGGKTGTTTQSVQIPPEVLARYNSVNATAQQTAAQPFQKYSTNPNAFVAPLTQSHAKNAFHFPLQLIYYYTMLVLMRVW